MTEVSIILRQLDELAAVKQFSDGTPYVFGKVQTLALDASTCIREGRETVLLEVEGALRRVLSSKSSQGLVESIIEDLREELHQRAAGNGESAQ